MLSADLFSQIRPEFLRLLGSPAAGLYLDAADEVEREAALRAGPLARDEALAIVERAVERNGEIEIEDAAAQTVREKARAVLDRLCAAGWLMAEDRADYSRFVLVEPDAAVLLEALRKIARPGAVVFSDALVGTCNALRNTAALAAEPWQTVQKCIQDTRQGERELRAVSKSVERHTRRQLGAQSLRENLSVVFDEYAANVGRGAYAELVRSRLPTRLPEAREAVERLQLDPELLAKMAAELARRDAASTRRRWRASAIICTSCHRRSTVSCPPRMRWTNAPPISPASRSPVSAICRKSPASTAPQCRIFLKS